MKKEIKSKEELIETVREMLILTVELEEVIKSINSQMDALEKENTILKKQLAFEQRQNIRHGNNRSSVV